MISVVSVRRSMAVAAVSVTAMIAAACGGASDSSTTDSVPDAADTTPAVAETDDPVESSATAAQPDAVVPELLQFTSPLVGGGELDAATLATKPTAFWFWSPT